MRYYPAGLYRFVIFHDAFQPVYWFTKFYDQRIKWLPAVKRSSRQILVKSIGGLAWINVNEHDLFPLTDSEANLQPISSEVIA